MNPRRILIPAEVTAVLLTIVFLLVALETDWIPIGNLRMSLGSAWGVWAVWTGGLAALAGWVYCYGEKPARLLKRAMLIGGVMTVVTGFFYFKLLFAI